MKLIRALFFILIVTGCLYGLLRQLVLMRQTDSSVVKSPLPASVSGTPATQLFPVEANPGTLKDVVIKASKGISGVYGMYIKNFKTGEIYFTNEHKIFDSASLYKLWVTATVYKQIQNGQLRETQTLRQDVAVLNQKFSIASDSAELTEGTITLTVHDALTKMITTSDNYAALLLTEKIRLSSVATFLKEHGLSESAVGTTGGAPTATPYDIAIFLEKLYKGDFANSHYTDEMINLLKHQQLNGGIPKYLPDKSKVANKTGEIDLFKHDAGIVFTDYGDYVIVILSETEDPPAAQERIAGISRAVYTYFTRKR